MFKRKEPKPVKFLFSYVPVGSIFFRKTTASDYYKFTRKYKYSPIYGDTLELLVESPLEDLEIPYADYLDVSLPLWNFVYYSDIKAHGFNYCIKHKIYNTIDSNYINDVRKLRAVKTLKGLKELLERKLWVVWE